MKKTPMLGLLRGFLWEIIGTAFGLGFVTLVRVLMHLPAWKTEPAVVVGALFDISITAAYQGDDNYAASSGSATHSITRADTTTGITGIDAEPSVNGEGYDVGVNVAPVAPGSGIPRCWRSGHRNSLPPPPLMRRSPTSSLRWGSVPNTPPQAVASP